MNNKGELQRNFVLFILIILSVAVLVVIPSMWFGYGLMADSSGKAIEASIFGKIWISLGGLILLIFGWVFFFRQKRINEGNYQRTGIDSVIEAGYKAKGYYDKVYAVIGFVIGAGLILLSLAFFIGLINPSGTGDPTLGRVIFGIIILVISIIVFIRAYIYWWRAKPLIKGKMY